MGIFDPDEARVKLKDTLSPSEMRKFFKFLTYVKKSSDSKMITISCFEAESVSTMQTLAEVFKLSEKWGFRDPKPHYLLQNLGFYHQRLWDSRREIMRLAHFLEYRDSLDLIRTIKTRQQALILKEAQFLRKTNTYALLRLVSRTGIPVEKVYVPNMHKGISEYCKNFEKLAKRSPNRSTLHLGTPSTEFTEIVLDIADGSDRTVKYRNHYWNFYSVSRFQRLNPTSLLLMRALYGEQTVLDSIKHLSDANHHFEVDEFIDILEQWETLKDYPAEWIIEYMCYSESYGSGRE